MLFMKNEEKKMTKKERIIVAAKVAASVTVIGGCVYFGSDYIKLKDSTKNMKTTLLNVESTLLNVKTILLNSGTIDCAVQNLEGKLDYYGRKINEFTALLNSDNCPSGITNRRLANYQAKYDKALKCLADTLEVKRLADEA